MPSPNAPRTERRFPGTAVMLGVLLALTGCGTPPALRREADAIADRVVVPEHGASRSSLLRSCQSLASAGLFYTFGSADPKRGGMDCSGTIHYLLSEAGYQKAPRQSNHQYHWLARHGSIHHAASVNDRVLRRLRPGDLLFWKGTYSTGRRWPDISHVMLYGGRSPDGQHWMFGGRSSGRVGRSGHEIDFHPLLPSSSEGKGSRFVGWGTPPGLRGKAGW